MIGERVLEFPDLQRLSGYDQAAAVERWAAAQGLRLRHGRSGPWTTVDALNAALGVVPANDTPAPLSPDLVG